MPEANMFYETVDNKEFTVIMTDYQHNELLETDSNKIFVENNKNLKIDFSDNRITMSTDIFKILYTQINIKKLISNNSEIYDNIIL